jgi:hypothetical protein
MTISVNKLPVLGIGKAGIPVIMAMAAVCG